MELVVWWTYFWIGMRISLSLTESHSWPPSGLVVGNGEHFLIRTGCLAHVRKRLKLNSSVQFSRSVVSNSLQPHEPQHARPPFPSPTPGVYPNSCPSSRWCHPTISSSVVPFSSCLNLSQHQSLFKWVSSSHQVAKVLEFQLQHQSFQWTPRTDLL